ncbi:MAG: hypothetical protein HFI75_01440 [Lachnospiraceae bacterium]|nr:hypothetical protein [Lachnospiraceae bacterium]
MKQILDSYYADNARKLHRVVNQIFYRKYGGIANQDMDEFYSVANDVFTDIIIKNRYDSNKGDFDGFLYTALELAIVDEQKRQNRDKRRYKVVDADGEKRVVHNISLDALAMEEDRMAAECWLQNPYQLEEQLIEELENEKLEQYLAGLSGIQRQIVAMKMEYIPVSQIKQLLKLSDKQYKQHMNQIKSYENTKYLFRDSVHGTDSQREDKSAMEGVATTTEKTKNTSYAVSAISKKLMKHHLRDDHVLQRTSGQWNNLYKSELISDILQGKALTQVIISEEIKDGIIKYWLIDGKQRCTNIDEYLHDVFPVSKNVQRYEIQYQANKKDAHGNDVLTEDGFPIPENRTFDIRNKKFSQLPEELQDQFQEYQIPVMLNLNCTKKEIAYDIARFNRCRPMTVAQNGWTGLEEDYAEFVDNILKMDFFQEGALISSYRQSNKKSGMMRRMIVESIMVINDLDNFHKDFRKMCEYLSKEANDSTFIEFYSLIDRLSQVSNKEIAEVFNIKDSFLWFGLFERFTRLGVKDIWFAEFVRAFISELHKKKVKGITYDLLNEKSTKDKSIVIQKLEHLELLMKGFLQEKGADRKSNDTLSFVREQVDPKVDQEDMEQFEEVLEGLTQKAGLSTKLLHAENRPSFLAIVAYSFKKDIDLDDWISDYVRRVNTYFSDQKKNYQHMKADLDHYLQLLIAKGS